MTETKPKGLYFTFLLYPDSAPKDWKIKLETMGVAMAVSPLHDKDKSKREGEKYKKPHYHVIYVAKNNVTADSVRNKLQRVFAEEKKAGSTVVAKVQTVINVQNMYEYLTHESVDAKAKKKHVYDKKDILHINNFDIDRYITLDTADKEMLRDLICDLIMEHELPNIIELKLFVNKNEGKDGIPTSREVNKIVSAFPALMRLYFDGVYQNKKQRAAIANGKILALSKEEEELLNSVFVDDELENYDSEDNPYI